MTEPKPTALEAEPMEINAANDWLLKRGLTSRYHFPRCCEAPHNTRPVSTEELLAAYRSEGVAQVAADCEYWKTEFKRMNQFMLQQKARADEAVELLRQWNEWAHHCPDKDTAKFLAERDK